MHEMVAGSSVSPVPLVLSAMPSESASPDVEPLPSEPGSSEPHAMLSEDKANIPPKSSFLMMRRLAEMRPLKTPVSQCAGGIR